MILHSEFFGNAPPLAVKVNAALPSPLLPTLPVNFVEPQTVVRFAAAPGWLMPLLLVSIHEGSVSLRVLPATIVCVQRNVTVTAVFTPRPGFAMTSSRACKVEWTG